MIVYDFISVKLWQTKGSSVLSSILDPIDFHYIGKTEQLSAINF